MDVETKRRSSDLEQVDMGKREASLSIIEMVTIANIYKEGVRIPRNASPEQIAEDKALVWKQDLRIVPLCAFIYLLCYLDRSNIGQLPCHEPQIYANIFQEMPKHSMRLLTTTCLAQPV